MFLIRGEVTMANRICPLCGGKNTAKILWGMPAFTPELEDELNSGSVVLGGCCIIEPTPTHHCKDCDNDILYPFEEKLAKTEYFEFQIGGFFCGYSRIMVENDNGRYTAAYAPGFANPEDAMKTEISEEEFVRFITGIYRCCLWEWKDEYVDPGVLDGTQWTIRVRLNGQDEKEWYGSNDYPPLWKKFIKAVNTLPLPEIR